jgi:hypothetical protein
MKKAEHTKDADYDCRPLMRSLDPKKIRKKAVEK